MTCLKIDALLVLVFVVITATSSTQNVKQIIDVNGDINVVLLIKNCQNTSKTVLHNAQSLVNSAIWTAERVNFLEYLSPLKFGVSAYEVCDQIDYFKTIFDIYQQDQEYLLGIISDQNEIDKKILKFSEVLDVPVQHTQKYVESITQAAAMSLNVVGWYENVTVIAPNEDVLREFYRMAKMENICVKECHIYEEKAILRTDFGVFLEFEINLYTGTIRFDESYLWIKRADTKNEIHCLPAFKNKNRDSCPVLFNSTTDPFVVFGSKTQLEEFVQTSLELKNDEETLKGFFVPLDDSVPNGLPENCFVIIPPHAPATKTYSRPSNILPSPVLFEVAKPILNYIKPAAEFIRFNCNETIYKVNCLRSKYKKRYSKVFQTPISILKQLVIEPLRPYFVYDVFKVLNETDNSTEINRRNYYSQPFKKAFTYNIFDKNITIIDQDFEESMIQNRTESSYCESKYLIRNNNKLIVNIVNAIYFRTESWVYAFLSLSLLGVIVCVAVLIFIIVSICRRDILEGNPILTLILLLCVMLLFCSVLPFSLQEHSGIKKTLCTVKALSVTLAYCAVFSLILSRSILLATASKEIGFMSHIAGPVQSFMCLFIFGVQAALNLQIINKCSEFFENFAFLYLMSYNSMLLLLLLCLTPLIYKSQRNYREGKYFTFAIVLITLLWMIWIPLYILLDEQWKEAMLCLGLFGTGSIILGSVFIPRTYLMTIAAARDKITSTLPSLATATSTMDIYRANTQPIYDCVNFAAINAVSVARAPTAPNIQHPDLYSCPALPEDDDNFDFRCETPPTSDKVTRF